MVLGRMLKRVVSPRVASATLAIAWLCACGGSGPAPDAGSHRDAGGACTSDDMCDDGLFCNGAERCDPSSPTADVDGCAPAREHPCLAAQTCDEAEALCRTQCDITGDADGDGHDYIECGGDDCDDSRASVYPGNVEVCDPEGQDEDCDPTTLGVDADNDGDGHARLECCNAQADGTMLCGDDCDDTRSSVNPDALEVCDANIDNDCNGLADAADGVCVPCADGYRGFDVACEDIDECGTGAPCGGASGAVCMNTPGSYRCMCPDGYVAPASAGTCEDVDECASGAPCGSAAGATCINIPGAYVCSCPPGFSSPAIGGTCSDVDECASGTPCGVASGTACVNSVGSYVCICPAGFSAPAGGGTCGDVDECASGTPCGRAGAWSACTNVFGSYSCVCSEGYIGVASGGMCQLDDASLVSLVPSVGTLSPAFDPATTSYTWDIPWGQPFVQLTPSVSDPMGAVIRVEGVIVASGSASTPISVLSGVPQRVDVEVTTETSRVLTYSLHITPRSHYVKASSIAVRVFGTQVALSADGTTLAVASQRTAYVFRRVSDTWIEEASLTAANTEALDGFGSAVALSADGSTLAVGAAGEQSLAPTNPSNNSGSQVGAAYIFVRSGVTWTERAYLKASSPASGALFGTSLALSGDGSTLVSSALGEDKVYVFSQDAGAWAQSAMLAGSNTSAGDSFGRALALSFDAGLLAVSAPGEDSAATGVGGDGTNNSARDSGAVYVFTRSGTSWSEQAYVKAANTDGGDSFGSSLALSSDGSTLAVSSQEESSAATGVGGDAMDNSAAFAGAAYVFTRVAGVWSQEAYIKASNTESRDFFGTSLTVSADGSRLAIGAQGEASNATGIGGDQADNSLFLAGAAYVYAREAGLWSQQAYVKASNTGRGDRYGSSIALSGDASVLVCGAIGEASNATGVDGDGTDNTMDLAGAVYTYVN